jgi:hypothetical protein
MQSINKIDERHKFLTFDEFLMSNALKNFNSITAKARDNIQELNAHEVYLASIPI